LTNVYPNNNKNNNKNNNNKKNNKVKSKPLELFELAGKKLPNPPMLDIPFVSFYEKLTNINKHEFCLTTVSSQHSFYVLK
jgi:hypothetical protein